MNIVHLHTLDLSQLDVYARLTEAQLRNRLEPAKGVFIAESLKVVRIALARGYRPLSFLTEQKYVDSQLLPLCAASGVGDDVPLFVGPRHLLAQLTGYELTRGILCALQRPPLPTVGQVCRDRRRIAVLDGVVNATNTGAIFRAAAALGVEALLLTPTCCDPLNRRSVRVSMGTVLQLPWTWTDGPLPFRFDDLQHCLADLGFSTVALALRPDAVAIDDPRLRDADRLAIVMGTEGDGLAPATIAACNHVAMIPMQPGVDSLNVAAAAAVAFWQLRP